MINLTCHVTVRKRDYASSSDLVFVGASYKFLILHVRVIEVITLLNSMCMYNNYALCRMLYFVFLNIYWIPLHNAETIGAMREGGHLAYQMIYHRHVTTFARCCNHERVQI